MAGAVDDLADAALGQAHSGAETDIAQACALFDQPEQRAYVAFAQRPAYFGALPEAGRSGDWTDPDRGKIKLREYAETWITERPGLRPRTTDLYRWLLRKHIEPHLGGAAIGRLSTQTIREWRAALLAGGVSVSVAAKAYRLLRAILMTAVEEDKLLPRNPWRIRGGGAENTAERPVLTVAQVFELAEQVGRRPVGNIRKIPSGYRLRFCRHGEMRTSPEVYATRTEADRALWTMASDDRADSNHDRRFYALVLLATFASLRWGEATALRRCDLDLDKRTVRIRAPYIERSTGEMLLGPPKSKAGRRVVGIPDAIFPMLRDHLAVFVKTSLARSSSLAPRAGRYGGATSTRCPPGRTPSRPSACRACTSTISGTRATSSRRRAAPHSGT